MITQCCYTKAAATRWRSSAFRSVEELMRERGVVFNYKAIRR